VAKTFSPAFLNASQRTAIALLMADAYSRTGKPTEEFVIYDSVLQELAAKADRIPLEHAARKQRLFPVGIRAQVSEDAEAETRRVAQRPAEQRPAERGIQVNAVAASAQVGARSPEYARVLERYLAVLSS